MRIPGLDSARTLNRRVGNRGAVLLMFGSVDLIYSVGLMFPTAAARTSQTFQFIAATAPLWLWATAWGVVGLLCWAQAFMLWDRVAYAFAAGLKFLFGLTCLGGWAVGAIDRGYISATIWLGLGGLMLRISRWPEPPPEPRR